MTTRSLNAQQVVDRRLMGQKSHHNHHGNHFSHECELCKRQGKGTGIDQQDLDMLELMRPQFTPQQYMRTLIEQAQQGVLQKKKGGKKSGKGGSRGEESIGSGTASIQLQINSEALKEREEGTVQREHLMRVRDQCYCELGRRLVRRETQWGHAQLGPSNYHTRQYLLPLVREEVTRLQAENSKKGTPTYYMVANANAKGINFEVDAMPEGLQQHLSPQKYREIAYNLNQIIQKNVYLQRVARGERRKMTGLYLVVWLILGALVLGMVGNSQLGGPPVVEMLCLVGSLVLMVFMLMLGCHRFKEQPRFVSIVELIDIKITDYLQHLNSTPGTKMIWKTSPSLYWIEIALLGP